MIAFCDNFVIISTAPSPSLAACYQPSVSFFRVLLNLDAASSNAIFPRALQDREDRSSGHYFALTAFLLDASTGKPLHFPRADFLELCATVAWPRSFYQNGGPGSLGNNIPDALFGKPRALYPSLRGAPLPRSATTSTLVLRKLFASFARTTCSSNRSPQATQQVAPPPPAA